MNRTVVGQLILNNIDIPYVFRYSVWIDEMNKDKSIYLDQLTNQHTNKHIISYFYIYSYQHSNQHTNQHSN